MKKFSTMMLLLASGISFLSCGSDSDSFDPYNEQKKTEFFPSKLVFRSSNNNSETTENWTFTYDDDNNIGKYTYKQNLKSGALTIVEQKSGKLSYYEDYEGKRRITNRIYTTYTSRGNNTTYTYKDTITEDVTFNGNLIAAIETSGVHNVGGKAETVSHIRTFTYSGDYLTGSTFKDNNSETTYTYKWNGERLAQVTVHTQNNANSDLTHDTYDYTYEKKEVSSNYGFNTLAFIYGHNPQIYAAMGFFGKTTPYLLATSKYSSYERINGVRYETQAVDNSFDIVEKSNSVVYTAESTGYDEYTFTFSE